MKKSKEKKDLLTIFLENATDMNDQLALNEDREK